MTERTEAMIVAILCWMATGFLLTPFAAGFQSDRSLLFREDWKEIPAETPVRQEHVNDPGLTLCRHGIAGDQIKKSHHPEIPNDPFYVWSGQCDGSWGVTLSRDDGSNFDLSRGGMIRWRSRQSGGHSLRILIRLSDGRFFVSDQGDAGMEDWHLHEFEIGQVTWRGVNLETFQLDSEAGSPDLAQVQSIGFTDLKSGRGSDYCSRLDWIEVYGTRH